MTTPNQKTGHTPTPWGFGDLEKGSKRPMWEHIVDSHGTQISTVMQSIVRGCQVIGPETQEEAEANAAFIVRACNAHEALVAALKALITDAEAMDKRLLEDQPDPGCEKGSITRARAALKLSQE